VIYSALTGFVFERVLGFVFESVFRLT